ncbi:hypothetical protein ES705_02056 [subsurface metagenome]|nr:hypothetical protein [Clostridia bacterium]
MEEVSYGRNPEITWTSPTKEMAREAKEIGKFARTVRTRHKRVVIEETRLYEEVAATIAGERGYSEVFALQAMPPQAIRKEIESNINNLEETLFVVSSPKLVGYLCEKLAKSYKAQEAQEISVEGIESKVRKHIVVITETNTRLAEKAKKLLRTFNVPEGTSGSSAIFSEGALFILALAGVDIEQFVESGIKGLAMCREEKLKKNPGAQLTRFLEATRKAGREQIALVLPEKLRGFGRWWQRRILDLGIESSRIIPVGEEVLSNPGKYGKKTAFIKIKIRTGIRSWLSNKWSVAFGFLKGGEPVLEITLPGKKAIGGLYPVAGFATRLSYPTGIGQFESASVPVTFRSGKELSPAEALSYFFGIEKSKSFSKYIKPGALSRGRKVFLFDFDSLFKMDSVKRVTPWGMDIELKVKPRSKTAFEFMDRIVKVAEEEGNPDGVKFAFVSSRRDLPREVIEQILRDYMSRHGLSAIARVIDKELIIDRETLSKAGGIAGISRTGKISTKVVFSLINRRLGGRRETRISIITDNIDRWEQDVEREMVKNLLWVVLEPAKKGEVLSTAAGLAVAIEGKYCAGLEEFIRANYFREDAERLLSQIKKGNRIILPPTPIHEEYLEEIEAEGRIYKFQA